MSYIGSLDQGTSSTRFMIFDHDGNVAGQHQVEHQQILTQPGWVEHDPAEIWLRTQEVIAQGLKNAHLQGRDLAAVGIANQRETALFWDIQTGKPLANAIVWQDTRTAEFLSSLSSHNSELLQQRTGLTVAPYFSASKFHWLLENIPAVQQAVQAGTARAGTIDSWLLWNLSGGTHSTDVTNASRTLLMNLETLDWDEELLAIFGVPRSVLPSICSSSQIYALTDPAGPFGCAIPIAAMLGDQQAAMVGQACFEKGASKTTYGTGNFALVNTGTEIVKSNHGLLTTVLYKFGTAPAVFALEGSVAVTGSAIQWLRDQLGIISNAGEVESLALSVEDNGGVYFVPAFSGLFAPYWRGDARGVIVGLTRSATKAHLARAALEAIGYQTKEILDAMSADSGLVLTQMRVDGGITANNLCMQLQADVMGIEIIRPLISETTALGAAYAAGLAVGFWSGTDEIKRLWKQSERWLPRTTAAERGIGLRQWKKALERSLNWVE